ncbi:enolase C-terminal domain-like protein [Blattabacterium cuenoti]|uniref:enolase C-terminal domain-like protein n=1 Tax=Blattabacterium cuenoti TaxID=1653831 RepID=UPI001EEC0E21|nr:enolase C-terminal domain-like protein [Blattabacterium cuenoti]
MIFYLIKKKFFFKSGIRNSITNFNVNTIFFLVLKKDNKNIGIGECNPLLTINYNNEKLNDIENNIINLFNYNNINFNFYRKKILNPYILFAFEQMFLFFKKKKFPILYNSNFTKGKIGIPVNNLIWLKIYKNFNKKKIFSYIENNISNGFLSLKIKIDKKSFDYQYHILLLIHKKYPFLQIRLDANGCFSDLNETIFFTKILKNITSIYYIEQPIPRGNFKEMKKICKKSIIPIALDEELNGIIKLEKKRNILDFIKPQYIIIKPSINGGFSESEEWIIEADKRNIKWCISSSLESNIGINAISQWTFLMINKYKKNNLYYHGLNTFDVYKNSNLFPIFFRKNGFMWYNNKIINFYEKKSIEKNLDRFF